MLKCGSRWQLKPPPMNNGSASHFCTCIQVWFHYAKLMHCEQNTVNSCNGKYKVWCWENFHSWKDPLWQLMGDILTPSVVNAFKISPPEYVVGDDLSWLEEIIEDVTGLVIDVAEVLAVRLPNRYHALRAYHGSRPLNVSSFYEAGLHRLNPAHLEQRAYEIYLNSSFPELSFESVQSGIEKVGRTSREGLLYFEANESHLIEYCAHYMLYGSEYLCAIAANVQGPHDYRQHLKKFGTPTIFVCDVPLALLDYRLLKEFAGQALESMFSQLIDPAFKHGESWRGAGLYIRHDLPREYLVGHKTPSLLKDPMLGYRIVDITSSTTSHEDKEG